MLGWYPTMPRSFLGPRESWELIERDKVQKEAVLHRASRETEGEAS